MGETLFLSREGRQAAREAGRRLAPGTVGPMREVFAEVAEAGAQAAVRVQPSSILDRGVPQHVRDAYNKRHTKYPWTYGSRILWGRSHVDDRGYARECVKFVTSLLEAEDARASLAVPTPEQTGGD